MISIRKAWWATLVLTVFIGCTNEEPAGETPASPPPASTDAPMPPATPPAGDLPKVEPAPAPEPTPSKGEMPKAEAPNDGELKIEGPAVTPPPASKVEGAEKKDEASATGLKPDEIAELATLSAADKLLAMKQVVCPVSGENLGSMGAPVKVSAEGKAFLICCDGCKEEVKDNPKEVVAKLKK